MEEAKHRPPKLSILMPAYNEVGTIGEIIRRGRTAAVSEPWEQIVIDDGSTDDTRSVLERVLAQAADEIRSSPTRSTEGKARRSGRPWLTPRATSS